MNDYKYTSDSSLKNLLINIRQPESNIMIGNSNQKIWAHIDKDMQVTHLDMELCAQGPHNMYTALAMAIWNKAVQEEREACAKVAEEPVATVTSESENPNLSMSWWHEPALPVGTKIYTSPQPNKQWVGLTDEEIYDCEEEVGMPQYEISSADLYAFARDIEAKLREKNHG